MAKTWMTKLYRVPERAQHSFSRHKPQCGRWKQTLKLSRCCQHCDKFLLSLLLSLNASQSSLGSLSTQRTLSVPLIMAQRAGIFNFGTDRVRVLVKTLGSGRVSSIFAKRMINRVFAGIGNLDRVFSGKGRRPKKIMPFKMEVASHRWTDWTT